MQHTPNRYAMDPARPRQPRRARLKGIAAAVIALAAGLVAPAAASADHYLGSTLSAPATIAEAFPQDTTFWATALPALPQGAFTDRTVVPESGQIAQFQVRGFAGGGFGPQPIFFQDLRPTGNGTLKVIATSQQFMLPATDGVWSFDPTNFCVAAGDRLGFSDLGGYNVAPAGIPFQVFGSAAGAQTQHFTKNRGLDNGAIITPTSLPPGVELLMAAYEGTGAHASPLCGGLNGIEFRLPQGTAKVAAGGVVGLSIGCQGPLPCNGQLTLQLPAGQTSAKGKRSRRPSPVLARTHIGIPSRHTSLVKVRLNARGVKLMRAHHGRLKVVLAVSAGAGGPTNTLTSTLTLSG